MNDPEETDLFFEIHRDNPQEGPGSFESTERAFLLLKDLPEEPRILDIGCGPGRQTLDLARLSSGSIVAVDNHKPYVENLAEKIKKKGLTERILAVTGDMKALVFKEQTFDLIWAEGSIYILGFERGLREWKSMLKHGGHLAVSEASWLRTDPPKDLKQFWEKNYPDIKTIEENERIILECGYQYLGHFVLPVSDWWGYYIPLEKKLSRLKLKYQGDVEALEVLSEEQHEIDLFRKYSKYYGYVFYIAQRYW